MKNKKDNYEIEVERRGAVIAAVAMIILACIYYCYEIFSGKGSNPAIFSIITLYTTIIYGIKAIKIEKCRKINAFISIVWGILTIGLIIQYFM